MMLLVPIYVNRWLIYTILFYFFNRASQYVDYTLGHCSIELHVGGEDCHFVAFNNIFDFKDWIASMQTNGFCLWSQSHYTPVIRRQNTSWFTFKARMKDFFNRAEKRICIYKGNHFYLGLLIINVTTPQTLKLSPSIISIILLNTFYGVFAI